MPTDFPTLSRAPQMNEEESFEDSTIRDQMENGAEFTRPRYGRMRRSWKVNYDLLTAADRNALRTFVQLVGGFTNFNFTDSRTATPETLNVRFAELPTIKDSKFAGGQKRFSTTFKITEL